MRYMFLIYSRETAVSQVDMEDLKARHWAVMEETQRLGIFEAAGPLQPTGTATTVRMQEGKPLLLDGPFAETKEQLAGYYILDCRDLDEAIAWAARIPSGCKGLEGCIEIRPLGVLPPRPTASPGR